MRVELRCRPQTQVLNAIIAHVCRQDLLVRAMQSSANGLLYLQFDELALNERQQLLRQLRRIHGVFDARIVAALPSEIEHKELQILLDSLPYPVVLVNKCAVVRRCNRLFRAQCDTPDPIGHGLNDYVKGLNASRCFSGAEHLRDTLDAQLNGQHYVADLIALSQTHLAAQSSEIMILFKTPSWLNELFDSRRFKHGLDEQQFIASSQAMAKVMYKLKQLLDHPMGCLIYGESGVGKQFLAQLLHRLTHSHQASFVDYDCRNEGGISLDVLDGLLKPGIKTLLIKNIEHLTWSQLAALVAHVHISKQRPHHLLFTSRQSPQQLQSRWEQGSLALCLPQIIGIAPLRQRQDDIVPLAQAWLDKKTAQLHKPCPTIKAELASHLTKQAWPGNIPELYQYLNDWLNLDTGQLKLEHPPCQQRAQWAKQIDLASLIEQDYHSAMSQFEHLLLSYHFPQHPSSRQLAKKLGISHTAIANKLREHNIRSNSNKA